jgi:hypothetical protein
MTFFEANKGLEVPILLLAWRRPHTLMQVIDAIRPIAPTRIFVACDGPSEDRHGEAEKVSATRSVIEESINWSCQIERFYSDFNQGCRLGVSRAISWFFDHVDEGIILEDDCIPHPDFFPYCASLLERYRFDTRVWSISGNNFCDGPVRGDGSYYFGQIPMCWGWATWNTRWRLYDSDMSSWPVFIRHNFHALAFRDPAMRNYWCSVWNRLYVENRPDSWAYRWALTCVVNGGLTAVPNVNLVSNVGFGNDATHTSYGLIRDKVGFGDEPFLHPSFVLQDYEADSYIFDHHFGGKVYRFPFSFLSLIRLCLRRIVSCTLFPKAFWRLFCKKPFLL